LFGALQDLGPRHAQRQDRKPNEPDAAFDTFSTELGWAADSFWSYFSVDGDLPFPSRSSAEDEDTEQLTLLDVPQEIQWCVSCGRKRGTGANSCVCPQPPLRSLKIFHRQGMNRWGEVVDAARSLCETSPTHQCDAACYDCLKDFGNQQYHDTLDRNTVLRFLKP
jgi:hypothetical protein